MSLRTDVYRKQLNALSKLESLLTQHNCSVGFDVVDGTHASSVRSTGTTPDELKMLGGMYAPALGAGSDAVTPATTLTVLPIQLPALLSNAPIVCLTAGQRAGKTVTGVLIAIKTACEKPGAKIAYILPSWSKLTVVKPFIDQLAAPLILSYRLSTAKWTFHNGSTIQAFSISSGNNQQTSYLGHEFDLCVLEEYREFKSPEEHFQGVYSRIISRAGRIIVVSSPEVAHPLEQMAQGKYNGLPVEVHELSALQNPFAKPLEDDPDLYFRLAEQLYPSDVYARNVLGKYVQDMSVDFRDFDRTKHVGNPVVNDITGTLYTTQHYLTRISQVIKKRIMATDPFSAIIALDMGLNNSALIMGVNCPAGTVPDSISLGYHVKAEIKGADNEGLVRFLERLKKHPLLAHLQPTRILVCCDPYSSQTRSIVDGRSAYQVLAAAGFKTLFDRTTRVHAKDTVNAKFKAGKITIDQSCKQLIESLLKFKDDGRGQKALSKDKYGHFCDALKACVGVLTPWKDIEAYILSLIYKDK